jgi:hypothetical protein
MPIPKLVITAALMIANMAMTMTRKIEGPRLDDLKFTGGDYGGPLPMIWGTRRMPGQIIWAEDLTEVKRRRKTKGGKFNEYTYFGTWAVALAGHEISDVSRIWFDKHLVYDRTGAGPVTPFSFGGTTDGGSINDYVAIYLGTETQEPDPRMQATVEAEFGDGSCPAYRGTAYVVFKDIPLEKFGNRIPQTDFEILGAASESFPFETEDTGDSGFTRKVAFSSDYTKAVVWGDDRAEVWELASRSLMLEAGIGGDIYAAQTKPGFRSDGTVWFVDDAQTVILEYAGDFVGVVTEAFDFGGQMQQGVRTILDGNGNEHWFTIASSIGPDVYVDGTYRHLDDEMGVAAFKARSFFADKSGNIWVVGDVDDTTAAFYKLVDIGEGSAPMIVTATALTDISGGGGSSDSGIVEAGHYDDADGGHFILKWGDVAVYAIDMADGSVIATRAGTTEETWLLNLVPGAPTAWIGITEVDLSDLTTIRTIDPDDWTSGYGGLVPLYDPVNHALLYTSSVTQVMTWFYLDRVGSAAVTLATIAGDIADFAGVDDHDFSGLDQTVSGWSATRGPASAMLEPLLDVYDSDIRPHDFSVQGVKRHGVTSGATLETEWFVGDPRYTVKVRQSSELPRAVIADFADIAADQQPNTVRTDRPVAATDAVGELKIDLTTLVLSADTARQLADRLFRRQWNERREITAAVTTEQLALEPGDVRTLSLDGDELTVRCVRLTIRADDVLEAEWRFDDPALALLDGTGGAPFDGREEATVPVPLLSKGFVLDIPLLSDADEVSVPQLYLAAAPYANGTWPGATIYQSVDGEYSEDLAGIAAGDRATWGWATDVLPDANPWVWDRGSSVNIVVQVGTLTGATEAAIDANPRLNLALLGDEIIQFTTATLEGDGSYTLSGFKRGRRGTEWACSTHAIRDVFLLLDTAEAEAMGLSDVGDSLSFKAVTGGRTEAGALQIPVTFTGATLKPYAPAHLEAVKESNGDWTITWVRRSRIGGAWVSGTTVPLGEASEEYEVDILDGADVVRTFGAADITENGDGGSVTYTAAQQTTDFGAEVTAGNLDLRAYQISAAVDRGFAATLAA